MKLPTSMHGELGRYRLIERVGGGATAEVFFAVRLDPGGGESPIVLKRALPAAVRDPSTRRRFLAEGRLLERLDHPGIVRLIEAGEIAGVPFLALERVDGKDLASLLDGGRAVPARIAGAIALRIAQALAEVHEQLSIVHRDVSPENVLVSRKGEVKLVDFGIAAAFEEDAVEVEGKAGYLAPEAEIAGAKVDARADLYAAGALLHRMLTAALPEERDRADVHAAGALPGERDRAITVLAKRPGLGPAEGPLLAVAARCLAREPDARFPTARALASEIADALESAGGSLPDGAEIARWMGERDLEGERHTIDRLANQLLSLDEPAARSSTAVIARVSAPPGAPLREDLHETERIAPLALARTPRGDRPSRRRSIQLALPAVITLVIAAAVVSAVVTRGWVSRSGDGSRAEEEEEGPVSAAPRAPAAARGSPPAAPGGEPDTAARAPSADTTPAPEERDPQPAPAATAKEERSRPRARAPAPKPAGFGTLSVNSIPWARVWIDGELLGDTPIQNAKVRAGTHKIVLRTADGRVLRSFSTHVRTGEHAVHGIDEGAP